MTSLLLLALLSQAPSPVIPQDIHRPRADPFTHLADGGVALTVTGTVTTSGGGGGAVTQGGPFVVNIDGGVMVNNFPASQAVTGTFFQATQPVSGPLTDAELRAAVVPVSLTSTTVTGSVAVTGPLTDAQLRAVAVPVSGTVTVTDGSGALTVDGTVTANAGTNLNTSALNLEATQTAMSAKLPATLGQKTMANSMAVVVASDQSAVPVSGTVAATQSGTWTVQPGNTANSTPWLTTDTPRVVASANNAGTCTSVTASTTVLASNSSRRAYGFKASEDNTAKVHCKLGATATTSNTIFGAGAGWSQDTGGVYTGVIDCIAASGTQAVCVYEVN